MTEGEKPVQDKKPVEMIPLSDLVAFKKGSLERERRLKEELAESKEELAHSASELQIAKVNTEDDEEIKTIKTYLLDQEKKLRADREKHEKDVASFNERDKEARVQALATQYGVDVESIGVEDDPEKKALQLYAERLAREKEELEKQTPESVFETGPAGSVKKGVWQKSDEEFEAGVKSQRQEALSQK